VDLNFSEGEERLRAEVRAFVRARLPAGVRAKTAAGRRLTRADYLEWHRALHAQGWAAPHWPQQFGGLGWSAVEQHIFEEELAAADAPRPIPFGTRMVGPVIMAFGSPQQQGYFLPRILSGEHWWCQGYSEPGAGSDLASLKTRAVRSGTDYIVNGQKTWTTLAHYANWIFCLVRTDAQAKAQSGISFLLIDMSSPGITVRPIVTLDGAHEINEVWFQDVRVPADNLVGTENQGWTYAKFLLAHERTGVAGVAWAKRELARLKDIAARERCAGRPLIEDPLFAAKLAQLEIDLMALEITNLRMLDADRAKRAPGPEASLLKIKGSVIQQAISELLLEAVGPYGKAFAGGERPGDGLAGVVPEDAIGLAAKYCNERKISIYSGSNEIQRNIIARMILGF